MDRSTRSSEKRRPLRLAGIRRPGDTPPSRRRPNLREIVRRPVTWVIAVALAAVATMVTGILTALPGQVLDRRAIGDSVRTGDDIRTTTAIIHGDDQGYSMAMPNPYTPTSTQQELLRNTNADKATEFARQLRAAGGADLDVLTLRLLLEGRRNQEIRIVDIAPVNIKKERPFAGALFYLPPQAGAPNLQLMFNMDESFPQAREPVFDQSRNKSVPGGLVFTKTSIALPDTRQELVIGRFVTERSSISFALRLTYLIGGEQRAMTIDNQGRPFLVTARSCDPSRRSIYARAYELGGESFSVVPASDTGKFCR